MQSEPAAPSFIQYGPEHETGTAIARSVQQIFNTKNAKKIMHRFICSQAKKKVSEICRFFCSFVGKKAGGTPHPSSTF